MPGPVSCRFVWRLGYRRTAAQRRRGGHPRAAETRRPDPVPLHAPPRSARPPRRRQGAGDQGAGDPGATPPVGRPAPPGAASQAGTRRPGPALAAISRALPRARWSCFIVTPQTLLRSHRRMVAGAWTYPHRGPGRPPLGKDVQQLIVRLATENPRWGYQRIKGELLRRNVHVSATAIRTTLRRHGLDPAPRRAITPGGRSCASRPLGSLPVTSSPSRATGCAGCMCCSSSTGHPAGARGRHTRQPQWRLSERAARTARSA